MKNVAKAVELIKERDAILLRVDSVKKTKEWTKITIEGEDGAEHQRSFSFGGTSDNNQLNNKLAKAVHELVSEHFNQLLEQNTAELSKLLK